jgi:hypothetical protein
MNAEKLKHAETIAAMDKEIKDTKARCRELKNAIAEAQKALNK